MQLSRRMLLVSASLLLTVAGLKAQSPTDLSGHWEGVIEAPGIDVKIEIDVARNSTGELTGTISIPAQKLRGLLLSNIAGEDKSVGFQIKGSPGERTFKGTLADGNSISGDHTQKRIGRGARRQTKEKLGGFGRAERVRYARVP